MEGHQLKGIITEISDIQQISERFSKRDFVIKTVDRYPQELIFQLSNVRIDLIEAYEIGDQVTVHFDIKGSRARNGNRLFINLDSLTK